MIIIILVRTVTCSTNRRKAHYIGVAFAFSQAMIFFANAATFYFGAWLVAYNGLNYESMFKLVHSNVSTIK